MKQYLELLQDIKENGEIQNDERTGVGTIVSSNPFPQIRFDLSKGFPMVTSKKVPFKAVANELFWFLSGSTNIRPLLEQNVHIWSSDALRFNLESVLRTGIMSKEEVQEAKVLAQKANSFELADELIKRYENKILEDSTFAQICGELGPVYGGVWRGKQGKTARDQILELEQALRNGGKSRRMLVSAWDTSSNEDKALPPCHYAFQVDVLPESRTLSLAWNQRSVDTVLGLPFNIASYGLLTELLAKTHGYEVGHLVGNLGNTHIYQPHLPFVDEQLQRKPRRLPQLVIKNQKNSILDYTIDDIELKNYNPHTKPFQHKAKMFGGLF
jgi:thymidylate synthase